MAKSLSDIWNEIVAICDELEPQVHPNGPSWRENQIGCALGLFGETAELVDIHKHRMGMGSQLKIFTKEDVGEELGDLFTYWTMVCVSEGFSIDELVSIMERKMVIIRRRLEDRIAGGLGQIPLEKTKEPQTFAEVRKVPNCERCGRSMHRCAGGVWNCEECNPQLGCYICTPPGEAGL